MTSTPRRCGIQLRAPRGIVIASARWHTVRPLRVTGSQWPQKLHDYGDYPKWLEALKYPCPRAPLLASSVVDGLLSYRRNGPHAHVSAPTSEYLDPLFFVLGANLQGDRILTLFEGFHAGSLSMRTCLLVGRRKDDLRLPDALISDSAA